jgi:hypothetical protein
MAMDTCGSRPILLDDGALGALSRFGWRKTFRGSRRFATTTDPTNQALSAGTVDDDYATVAEYRERLEPGWLHVVRHGRLPRGPGWHLSSVRQHRLD